MTQKAILLPRILFNFADRFHIKRASKKEYDKVKKKLAYPIFVIVWPYDYLICPVDRINVKGKSLFLCLFTHVRIISKKKKYIKKARGWTACIEKFLRFCLCTLHAYALFKLISFVCLYPIPKPIVRKKNIFNFY